MTLSVRLNRPAIWLLSPALMMLLLLLAAPLVYLLSFSLFATGDGPGTTGALTFENYARLGQDPFYLKVFGKTLWLSALSTLISTAIGTILALFMWRAALRWRGLLT